MGTVLIRQSKKSGFVRVVAQWVDASGTLRQRSVGARAGDRELSLRERKAKARHLLAELDGQVERQRLGLAPRPLASVGITLGELHSYYEATRGAQLRSRTFLPWVRPHMMDLFPVPVQEVTTARIDRFLTKKAETLAGKSVAHLRGHLHAVFEAASVQGGPWEGRPNPVKGSWCPKPKERQTQIITPEEWSALEPHVFERWRPVAKVAFFTGLRRGDVFGLRKSDVDLWRMDVNDRAGTINATVSKVGKVVALPIDSSLRPELERALSTPGPYLFAWDRRKRLPNLVKMLRRACGRAGLVIGHELRCRAKGCAWSEERGGVAPPAIPDACPRCGRDCVYSRPIPRQVRFHDLRHSFGTAVVAAGGTGAGQALLAHSDPKMTARYTHLAEGLLANVVARAFAAARTASVLRDVVELRPDRVLGAVPPAYQLVGPPGVEPGRRSRGGRF